ncbi:hypothetical protein [Xanthomonas arboricola]|uniref:hypothetical protein n=1 Tax=Xanthomonas arboricola TaxID=56448 RepID=UPI001290270A|nr:hypothetical protein [Xanthomonas arboricola]
MLFAWELQRCAVSTDLTADALSKGPVVEGTDYTTASRSKQRLLQHSMTFGDTQRLRLVALAVSPIARDVLPTPPSALWPDVEHCTRDVAEHHAVVDARRDLALPRNLGITECSARSPSDPPARSHNAVNANDIDQPARLLSAPRLQPHR